MDHFAKNINNNKKNGAFFKRKEVDLDQKTIRKLTLMITIIIAQL